MYTVNIVKNDLQFFFSNPKLLWLWNFWKHRAPTRWNTCWPESSAECVTRYRFEESAAYAIQRTYLRTRFWFSNKQAREKKEEEWGGQRGENLFNCYHDPVRVYKNKKKRLKGSLTCSMYIRTVTVIYHRCSSTGERVETREQSSALFSFNFALSFIYKEIRLIIVHRDSSFVQLL